MNFKAVVCLLPIYICFSLVKPWDITGYTDDEKKALSGTIDELSKKLAPVLDSVNAIASKKLGGAPVGGAPVKAEEIKNDVSKAELDGIIEEIQKANFGGDATSAAKVASYEKNAPLIRAFNLGKLTLKNILSQQKPKLSEAQIANLHDLLIALGIQ